MVQVSDFKAVRVAWQVDLAALKEKETAQWRSGQSHVAISYCSHQARRAWCWREALSRPCLPRLLLKRRLNPKSDHKPQPCRHGLFRPAPGSEPWVICPKSL